MCNYLDNFYTYVSTILAFFQKKQYLTFIEKLASYNVCENVTYRAVSLVGHGWTLPFSFCTTPSEISHLAKIIMCRSVNSAIHNCPHKPLFSSIPAFFIKFHVCHTLLICYLAAHSS